MSTEVVMPQMGESLSEGTITKWLKKPGESVERDEPLFEITTDKVDTEVPAPAAGSLERILVNEGETVSVGTVVAVIGDGARAPAREGSRGGGHFREAHEPQLFQRRKAGAEAPSNVASSRRPRLSPAVLALAAEHDLSMDELRSIPGSGRDGRVTRRDVEQHLDERFASPAVRSTSDAIAAPKPTEDLPSRYSYQPEPGDALVAMSPAQMRMAEQLLWSQRVSAQVTSFTECDVHRIARFRDEAGEAFEAREGIPLSFVPFVAGAALAALHEFPIFNASVVGDQIAIKKHVHLGIAASIEAGLIVPVVRRADEMSFIGLARAIHALSEKARGGALSADELEGATFTLTSPGMFGGMMGTPMIPQPQVAILALGSVQKKPVVVEDAIAIRPIMVLALTFDHRIIPGPTGFQFLETLRGNLESFDLPDV